MDDPSTDDLAELVRLKEPFVLRDYVSQFEVMSRNDAAVISIRGWQVTVTAGLIVILYSQPPSQPIPAWFAIPAGLLTWACFLGQEANALVFRDHAEKIQLKYEELLSATTLHDVRNNFINWRYGGTRSREELTSQQRWRTWVGRMTKFSVLLWHLPVLLVLGLALMGRYAASFRD